MDYGSGGKVRFDGYYWFPALTIVQVGCMRTSTSKRMACGKSSAFDTTRSGLCIPELAVSRKLTNGYPGMESTIKAGSTHLPITSRRLRNW